MFNKITRFFWRFALIFSLFVLLGLFLPKLILLLYASPRTFTTDNVPVKRVAIVFGAGLRYDGTPTAVLKDRVQTAVLLYQQGKVKKLLMSGDNSYIDYNEPESMRQYALSLGVPDQDIVLDYAGRRTYDTCYRANFIFQIDSAILVTQSFHLPRALFLCNWFGVESVGVESNNTYFRKISRLYWNTRELFAATQALWDVYVSKPVPVLGEPEPIFK
jgi:SanA protein